jgi:hypothetical protein
MGGQSCYGILDSVRDRFAKDRAVMPSLTPLIMSVLQLMIGFLMPTGQCLYHHFIANDSTARLSVPAIRLGSNRILAIAPLAYPCLVRRGQPRWFSLD